MEDITMLRHRHAPAQIVRRLREGDRFLNESKDLAEVLRHLEVDRARLKLPGSAR
jgi:hypothetical protein